MKLYKYQGAGNDFLIADNRSGTLHPDRKTISELCDRRYGIGADGMMLLENQEGYGFRMRYFNSDGSGGMMCGNGGRCIVAFAAYCGIENFSFIADDGPHTAEICASDLRNTTVRLGMKDVSRIAQFSDGYFLDTGTRHFVRFEQQLSGMDILPEGRRLRNDDRFAPIGTNVNFVEIREDHIRVRTFEKGVEDETFACGTGIVASALASWHSGHRNCCTCTADGRIKFRVQALRDKLEVDFIPGPDGSAHDIFLTGPAAFVACIETDPQIHRL